MRSLGVVRFIARVAAVTAMLSWVLGATMAASEPVLFGIDEKNDQLVRIDRDTSAIAVVGSLGATRLTGLTYNIATKTLLASGLDDNRESWVYTVDRRTGAAKKARAVPTPALRAPEALIYGAATGRLYFVAAGRGVSHLHLLDGESFLPIGLREGMEVTGGFGAIQGGAHDTAHDKLYAVDQATDRLLTINPLTGAGTNVGRLGLNNLSSLAYDAESDELYGWDMDLNQLVIIDRDTGRASPAGQPEGTSREGTFIRGLAFVPPDDSSEASHGNNGPSPASREPAQAQPETR